jgi:hypothetical protein
MVRPEVRRTFLFRHSLARPFLCHLRVHVLFRTVWALPVGTPVVVVVLRTAFVASQVEVHRRTLVPMVLRCTRCVVGPVGTAAVASTVAEVRMASPRSLPAAAGDAR